ncbi:Caffeine resistance protein 5 [Pseudocercospora fuligena]|uniref:Caffeine resistance protein 5 n=1 Tax=Pseudocercospora fuligena TaxID=685502 RepID=A0A8H6RFV6_9PEZI|nr:Caffeine resistance protein 5 [Pseudocercospora fuligena]
MTLTDAVRDSPAGSMIRLILPNLLQYPEKHSWFSHEWIESQYDGHFVDGSKSKSSDKVILCDWYDENDKANPKNWTQMKKLYVVLTVVVYSFVVYMSAPIWTLGEEQFMNEFGTNYEYTTLGLGLFILGYGIGPMIFSPLSEVPSIGRNIPYILTFIAFMLVTIPTALVRSAPAFMFFRFLQGFFGSPILSTGGASIQDVYSNTYMPLALTSWAAACFVAPVFGTIFAGAAIPHLGWRFSIWEILIASGPVLLLLIFLPETSSATILHRRAERLRRITGNDHVRSASEIAHMEAKADLKTVVYESLLIPAKITVLDPAILFVNIYLCLIYGIYYSFFEVFPLVYGDIYHFNLLQSGLAFLPLAVGTLISFICYTGFLIIYRIPRLQAGDPGRPELAIIPALVGSLVPPIGIFLFGWSANPNIHWIVTMIGVAMYPAGVFAVFQALFVYMAICYPRFSASLFAASAFTRCIFSLGAVLFARPLFKNLGIGPGCSLLAGLMVGCIFGVFAIFHYGPKLRARSNFTAKV